MTFPDTLSDVLPNRSAGGRFIFGRLWRFLPLLAALPCLAATTIKDVRCAPLDPRTGQMEVSYAIEAGTNDAPARLAGIVVDRITGRSLGQATLRKCPAEPLVSGQCRVVWNALADAAFRPLDRVELRLFAEPIAEEKEEKAAVVEEKERPDLLYHCTFDNASSISSPAAGPSGTFLGGAFGPGRIGGALRVERDTPAFETRFPKGVLGTEGCIEFWAKIEGDNPSYGDGGDPLFFTLFDERTSITLLQFAANNGVGRGGLSGAIDSWPFGSTPHYALSMEYATILGPNWSDWHHYAMSWKANAFPDGSYVKVFVDGMEQPVLGGVDDDKVPGRLANYANHDYALGVPWSRSRVDNRSSQKPFWMDELKIWKAAKTEFTLPNSPVAKTEVPKKGVPDNAEYLVIDLSGGSTADRYPVETIHGTPEGGWSEEFKTSKLVLRRLEPGSLTMGYHAGETPLSRDLFLREETIDSPFFMGVFEVTQRQWELVMGNRPSFFKNDAFYATRPVESVNYIDIRGAGRGSHWPHDNAVDDDSFLGRIRRKTGLDSADLPTSAQWEYACRAGTTTAMNNGRNLRTTIDDPAASEVCRYWSTAGKSVSPPEYADLRYGTAAVGSFKPNAWGLYDMHGNVWEWCRDWLVYTPPQDVRSVECPTAAGEGDRRIVRGGSWYDDSFMPRSSNFGGISPTSTGSNHGFRVMVEKREG